MKFDKCLAINKMHIILFFIRSLIECTNNQTRNNTILMNIGVITIEMLSYTISLLF